MSCPVMLVSRSLGIVPKKVFEQAALSQVGSNFQSLATCNYYAWLIDDELDPIVEDACRKILKTRKKERKKRWK